MEKLNLALLIGAAAIIVAIAAVRVAHRIGLPGLLVYLALGLLLGESALGIPFEDAELTHHLGLVGLAVILAEGGITTSWSKVKRAMPAALVLATVGVLVSIAVVAVAVRSLLGASWQVSLLMGAMLASTDAAAVFSVLRRLPLPPRLAGVLEAESGFNDAPAVIIVTLLSAQVIPAPSIVSVASEILLEIAIGAAVGLVVGPVGAYALRRVALPASGLYPIAVLALAFGAYSLAAVLHGSGFLAVYIAALILGNARLPHRPATRGFAEGVGWLAQIGLFMLLGLLASPAELPPVIVPGLVTGCALVLLARPISVAVSALVLRAVAASVRLVRPPGLVLRLVRPEVVGLTWREQAFLSWAGLRGAVPVVFATVPLAEGVPGAKELFNQVFVIVLVFTVLQGPTLPWVARRLGVVAPAEARELDVEAAPLEELKADLLQMRVPPRSRLHGVEIFELRLPQGANVTMIVRNGTSFVPDQATRIQSGDDLLVVTTANCRRETEARLRAVSRRGKLAGWHGEHGD
ncbi:potassium/proton antiporter [Bailinhaonella thermotolerans]|uniref:Potassium/proton antiporter n=1 Tax=Bailinhaonella thermotolerans TaxID=1070861 RepID=A0A3A4AUK1_9ACTN|nr:potassium/proton antiporter [Bailinhaonella thermotolerans]RJL33255.1 potassium/proton antiporter [Bailinhaonella thermotolerans]